MGKMNGLKFVSLRIGRWLAFVGLMPLLTACAGSVAPTAQAPTVVPAGQLRLGTVVSVRPAIFDGDNAMAQRILTTLNVPIPAEQEAVELVIRQQDNSVISIVQPVGPGQPDFVSGERVMIVETTNTVVRPQ
jgi:outer membrane lipoprotein SlyB